MNYVAQALSEETADRIISDSDGIAIAMIFKNAWQEQDFPEGFVFDAAADSYLVLVPFNLRDPGSNGDYAFFYNGMMHHVTFVAPSHSLVHVRDKVAAKISPSREFRDRLVAAFAAHHAIVRVIDGLPTPRGGLIVPKFGQGGRFQT